MSTRHPRRRTEQSLAYADRARNILDRDSADLVWIWKGGRTRGHAAARSGCHRDGPKRQCSRLPA